MKTLSIKGFTLIELLVGITIVSIVFGLVLSSSVAIQKTSRDAKRNSDLKTIQSALQQYYADQHFYPDSLDTNPTLTNCTGNVTTGCTISKTYLKTIPTDPSDGSAYTYTDQRSSTVSSSCEYDTAPTTKCNYYTLCATMENSPASPTCVDPL